MERHIKNVHDGVAMLGRIPKVKAMPPLPRYNAMFDTPLGSFASARKKERAKETACTDALEYVAEQIRKLAEFKDNCYRLFGGLDPMPYYGTVPVPMATAATSTVENVVADRRIIGFRGFICETCYIPEVVSLYYSSDPKNGGGLPTHVCQLDRAIDLKENNEEILKTLNDSMIRLFIWGIKQWTEGAPILYAIEVNELPSFPKDLNHVNFGIVGEEDLIYKAAKDGVTLMADYSQLWYFVSRTKATYCVSEFTYHGSKKFYFMFISTGRRHHNNQQTPESNSNATTVEERPRSIFRSILEDSSNHVS